MNEKQIIKCSEAILQISTESESEIEEILELLKGNIISEEDCSRILLFLTSLE